MLWIMEWKNLVKRIHVPYSDWYGVLLNKTYPLQLLPISLLRHSTKIAYVKQFLKMEQNAGLLISKNDHYIISNVLSTSE